MCDRICNVISFFFWDAFLSHGMVCLVSPRRTLTCRLRCSPASTWSSCFWTPWIVTRRGTRKNGVLLPIKKTTGKGGRSDRLRMIKIAIDFPAGSFFQFHLSPTFHHRLAISRYLKKIHPVDWPNLGSLGHL